jgi:hypothetical protein
MLKVKYILSVAFFSFITMQIKAEVAPIVIKYDFFETISVFFTYNKMIKIEELRNKLVDFQSGKKDDNKKASIRYENKEYSLFDMVKMKNVDVDNEELRRALSEAIDIFWDIAMGYFKEAESKTMKDIVHSMIKSWVAQRSLKWTSLKTSLLLDWANRGGDTGESELTHMREHVNSFKELDVFVKELYYFLGDMLYTIKYYKENKNKTDL